MVVSLLADPICDEVGSGLAQAEVVRQPSSKQLKLCSARKEGAGDDVRSNVERTTKYLERASELSDIGVTWAY